MAIVVTAVHSLTVTIFLKNIFSSAACSIDSVKYDFKKLLQHFGWANNHSSLPSPASDYS